MTTMSDNRLHIYNSLTQSKQLFVPIDPKNVRLYVCGMTVYDYCHVGHARVLVVFDVVYRYLRQCYGEQFVTYVRNITDIDDNIIRRAVEKNISMEALTTGFINEMNADAAALGVLSPTVEPKATEHIAQIITMVQQLLDNGTAYQASTGDVFFSVKQYRDYGKLSGRNIQDERAGARVEVNEAKRDPMDFVLWKMSKPNEPAWESPWGQGRPGWHIECSAMSTHCLGDTFDIHGGGIDLKFPHHENEIAQTKMATGAEFARLWMHNGHVMIDDEKMSKSLGNFFTVKEVLKHYSPEVLRYFILASHYRSPLSYSQDNLAHAKTALTRFYSALRGLSFTDETESVDDELYQTRFYQALDDDFNTVEAIVVLFDMVRELNKLSDDAVNLVRRQSLAALLKTLAAVLGLLQDDPEQFLQAGRYHQSASAPPLTVDSIEAKIAARLAARQAKNWAQADRIRDELLTQGIVLEDGSGDTTWRRD